MYIHAYTQNLYLVIILCELCYWPIFRLIINKKETCGPLNTPLHYAINAQWNEDIQKKLLNLGADLLAENKINETPLSRISHFTLRNFLDEYCMSATGFNQ